MASPISSAADPDPVAAKTAGAECCTESEARRFVGAAGGAVASTMMRMQRRRVWAALQSGRVRMRRAGNVNRRRGERHSV